MGALVGADAAAGAAGALGVVEHEEVGNDVAVHEPVRGAAELPHKRGDALLRRTAHHPREHERIAYTQGMLNPRLELLFHIRRDHEAIHERREPRTGRQGVRRILVEVHPLPVDLHMPTALLPNLREQELRRLAIDLEDRREQFHFGPVRQR